MSIQEHSVVSIQYTVKNDAGDVIDQSTADQPLTYLHGYNNIIPGLEAALVGKEVGDEFSVNIAAEDAYGERNEELINPVPRAMFQGVEQIEVGMGFTANTPQGPVEVTVVEVTDEMITVDGNHPLAGQALNFEIKVEEIREATDEELAHGHAHGVGGHDH